MSGLANRSEWPKIIGAIFDTGNNKIVLEFPENSFAKFDCITWDFRYGEELYVQDIVTINKSQLLTCTIRSMGDKDNWSIIHLDKYIPGVEFKVINFCIGEFDTIY